MDKKIEVAGIGGRAPRVLTKERLSVVTSPRYTGYEPVEMSCSIKI